MKVVETKRQKLLDVEVLVAAQFEIKLLLSVVKEHAYLLVKK